jgi:DNA-binding FadR family transcriptional regulator
MQEDFEVYNLSIKPDYNFHLGIAKASNNAFFAQLLEDSNIGLKKTMAIAQSLSRQQVKSNISTERKKEVLSEHQKIIETIESLDELSARGPGHAIPFG